MPEFLVKIARAIIDVMTAAIGLVGRFLHRLGYDWNVAWVPVVVVIVIAIGLWALALRKD